MRPDERRARARRSRLSSEADERSASSDHDPPATRPRRKREQHRAAGAGDQAHLQRHDLSVPGREVIQNRVDISPEAPFAGDVLLDPAEMIHAVKNVGSGNAAKLAYVVEKGKQFLVVVE